jgi:CopG antitoxin of type II toxin-antitoxin system
MKKPKIPSTDSIEEFARFWETHDATDFEDEVEEVTEPVFVRKPRTVMTIRLEPQEAEAVEKIAKARGVEESALLREWVRESINKSLIGSK